MMEENMNDDNEKDNNKKESEPEIEDFSDIEPSTGNPRTCCCACCANSCDCSEAIAESKNVDCCMCVPVSIGMVIIQVCIYAYVLWMTLESFLLLFNEYIDGYFLIILFVLLIPLYVAVVIIFLYARDKSKSKRNLAAWTIFGVIIVIVLISLWIIIYFLVLYHQDEIYVGWGSK